MSTIVEAEDLTKRFGDLTAIDNISFSLEAGKIYGLLGRNGSGKTTLLRLLTAQLFATGGKLLVIGEQPYENRRVLSQICFMKESQKYPRHWRVGDVLAMAAWCFPRWDADYASALSKDFHLPLTQKMRTLSRGALSAVGIVVGLASRVPLSIFDEPLVLDVVARSLFYERLIADYGEHPRTILVSTHLIDEVSRLLMFFSRKELSSWDSGFEAFQNRQKWLPCPLLHHCAPASPPFIAVPTSLPLC